MIRLGKDLSEYSHVLLVQVWVELKTSITNTRLGYLWYILDPLLLMIIYYFVVRVVFERGGPGYHIFILCGLVAWQWFAKSITRGTTAFGRSKSLIQQVKVPLAVYVLSPILIYMVFVLFGFAIVIIFSRNFNLPSLVFLFPLLIVQLLLTFSLCCFLSVANVHMPDIQKFVVYGLRFLFYLTPILYSPSRVLDSAKVPQIGKMLFLCNPFASLMPAYRDVLINGTVPHLTPILLWFGVSLMLLQIGILLVRSQSKAVPKMI